MFAVNEQIERKKREANKLYLGFLDIEKACDRMNRDILCKVLEKLGLSEKIVNIVRNKSLET